MNCFLVLTFSVVWNTPVIISIWIFGIDFYGNCVVRDRWIKVADLVLSKSTVEKCFEVIGVILQGDRIEIYCQTEVTLFPCLKALGVAPLSFLLIRNILLIKKFLHCQLIKLPHLIKSTSLWIWNYILFFLIPHVIAWRTNLPSMKLVIYLDLWFHFPCINRFILRRVNVFLCLPRFSIKSWALLIKTAAWTL